jgi:hypothetical protein
VAAILSHVLTMHRKYSWRQTEKEYKAGFQGKQHESNEDIGKKCASPKGYSSAKDLEKTSNLTKIIIYEHRRNNRKQKYMQNKRGQRRIRRKIH